MADTSAIHLQLGDHASKGRKHRGIVARVSADILNEIEEGDLPEGEVGVVVAIIRDVLEAVRESKKGRSAAAIEGIIRRVVKSVFDEHHPINRRIDSILWVLKTAAATDKKVFGGAVVEFSRNVSVEAVMAAMQKVQQTANAATKKLSAAILQTEFGKEMAALNLDGAVKKEAEALVEAGLVTEIVSMLKDDSDLSKEMTDKLKTAGLRLALQVGTSVAVRCAAGKCNWKAIFCCCGTK